MAHPELDVIATRDVLKHAGRQMSACLAWGYRVDANSTHFEKITCTECGGVEKPKGESTMEAVYNRVYQHATSCAAHYGQRAFRCVDADRKGDRFDCPAALHSN
ncbi:hypothetical protein OK074_2673 [Actinobacteria bacterium OK074]|nr:hypothetical protein OK074_2673 [Actinobacteria bacterium OK074]